MKSTVSNITLNNNQVIINDNTYNYNLNGTIYKDSTFIKSLGFDKKNFLPTKLYLQDCLVSGNTISNGVNKIVFNKTQNTIPTIDSSILDKTIQNYIKLFDGFISKLGVYTNDKPVSLRYEPKPSDSDIPDLDYRAYVPIDDKEGNRCQRCYIHLDINTNYIDLNEYKFRRHDFEEKFGKSLSEIDIPDDALVKILFISGRVYYCDLTNGIDIEAGLDIQNKTVSSQETIRMIDIYYEHN